ncbi:FecR family protein [Chitinophaga pinensis]|uniref:Anti-FecI sigma factor, FecR n=1 Tax=Chitinophaga pinensis (strain ATCC 43595 / DSM 2588 / LMG 13176 / NBRC 15968 / NCIMB 11800 / UQM 2034) TaxID=485918 RepID=A0A979GUG9_CHIPD|nr:FecR domain-containing protein [Chitinophaga pinensis]ACU60754.1 anti-FecI sigma factor, FecR [Chitinophaga pinensis DSM 2588]
MDNSKKNIDNDKLLHYLENGQTQDDSDLNESEQALLRQYQAIKEEMDLKEWAKADVEEGWAALGQRLQQQDIDWNVPKKIRVRPIWGYAAAAAVLLLAGASWYYFWSAGQHPSQLAAGSTEKSSPSAITLLTAEGDEVQLDTLKRLNGATAVNGEELIYEKGQETNDHISYNTLIVPRGYTYHLVLSDGTKVWLNADTRLRYPSRFPQDARLVSVEGEAYFEVTTDAARPFTVQSNHASIKVLGTAFNINTYENNIAATLVQGKIVVHHKGDSTYLSPGEQLLSKAPYDNAKVRNVDTDIYTAWKDGELVFVETTLEDICRRLERIYNYRIILPEGEIRNRKIEANLPQYKEISTITELLEKMTDVHFNVNQKERTITGYAVNK